MICPTVTVSNLADYKSQLGVAMGLSRRIHIDLMDGQFAPSKSPNLDEIWVPAGIHADLHMMYRSPADHLDSIKKIRPNLVIVPAESDMLHMHFSALLHAEGIKVGVALLPETSVESVEPIINSFDHVMVFSGNLGYQGGSRADLSLLSKVKEIRDHHPEVEIGWDGGVNEENVVAIQKAGVDVINVGGFIQKATDPGSAYAKLKVLEQ